MADGIVVRSGEKYYIIRQLDDPLDTDTNFVQAVVRKTKDSTILKTIDLTDKGSQRFVGEWQAITDASGQGIFVDIETIVYTDSGFLNKSENYAIESRQILIDLRYGVATRVFGGNVRSGVSEKVLKKALEEALENRETEDVDFSGVLSLLNRIITSVEMHRIKPTDINIIHNNIVALKEGMRLLPTEFKQRKVDLSTVLSSINEVKTAVEIVTDIENTIKEMNRGVDLMKNEVRRVLKSSSSVSLDSSKKIEAAMNVIDKLVEKVNDMPVISIPGVIQTLGKNKKTSSKKKVDIKKLLR